MSLRICDANGIKNNQIYKSWRAGLVSRSDDAGDAWGRYAMRTIEALSSIRRCAIAMCVMSLGMLMGSSAIFAQCDVRPQIQANDIVVGTLSFGDCTINDIFSDGDPSFVDLYNLTLPAAGVLTVRMDSSDFDALAGLMDPTFTILYAVDDDSGGNFNALFSVSLEAGNYTLLANSAFFRADTGAYTLTTSCVGCTADLAAAVLPASRSVQVGNPATAFAAVINTLTTDASSCGIAPSVGLPASFAYQTTDPVTNALVGTPSTPVDIVAGGLQTYVFALTPTVAFSPTDVELTFDCFNTNPAPVINGVNTLLVSASNTPVPDIVALAATPTGDGIIKLPGSLGANAFAVATVNVGSQDVITARPDTGSVLLPVDLFICETNPSTGACLSSPAASVTTTINAGATPTFTIFVNGNQFVPFDPANNRVFVRFQDAGGVTRGSTSVAVETI